MQHFQPRDNPVLDCSFFKPISREEWEQGLDERIRMGLAADAFSGLDMGDDE